jgi:hypothetical protein
MIERMPFVVRVLNSKKLKSHLPLIKKQEEFTSPRARCRGRGTYSQIQDLKNTTYITQNHKHTIENQSTKLHQFIDPSMYDSMENTQTFIEGLRKMFISKQRKKIKKRINQFILRRKKSFISNQKIEIKNIFYNLISFTDPY